jgi:hypothetical protein
MPIMTSSQSSSGNRAGGYDGYQVTGSATEPRVSGPCFHSISETSTGGPQVGQPAQQSLERGTHLAPARNASTVETPTGSP